MSRIPGEARQGIRETDAPNGIAPLKIQIRGGKTELNASSRAGAENSSAKLGLRLRATQPGWSLGIMATALKGRDNTHPAQIRANELHAREGQNGKFKSLQEPVPIQLHIPVGGSDVEIELMVAAAKENRDLGSYDGTVFLLARHRSGVELPPIPVEVKVDVKCEVTHRIWNNKLYFHLATPSELMESIQGELVCDAGLFLKLEPAVTGALIDKIPEVDVPIRRAKTISVEWSLSEDGESRTATLDSGRKFVQWELEHTPNQKKKPVRYQLNCKVLARPQNPGPNDPKMYQPGRYHTHLKVNLLPVL